MEAQRATVTLELQLDHVAGDVVPTDHLLEMWLLDWCEVTPTLIRLEVPADDDTGRVAAMYDVNYAGHAVHEPQDVSPDLKHGVQPLPEALEELLQEATGHLTSVQVQVVAAASWHGTGQPDVQVLHERLVEYVGDGLEGILGPLGDSGWEVTEAHAQA